MKKFERITIRISKDDKEKWFMYALSHNYDSLSDFIRDSINEKIVVKNILNKITIIGD